MYKESESPVMHTYGRFPITLVEGKGSYVWDEQGTKYLDFTSGIATCNLGHVPDVVEQAVQEQLSKLWHCSNLYHIPSQEKLAQALTDHSFGDQVFFCNSGAEANEAAIKIAKKYGHDVLKQDNPLIISFNNSFHGRTMATLSATGQKKIQEGFTPLTPGFAFLPFNDDDSLDELVKQKPVAVLLELVQGEGGVIPADPVWVSKLAATCQEHGILLMIDEIQTGMGRTGKLFAYQHYGIEPDVISVAKGLGSGFPIGAIIAKEHVAKVFSPGTHGSTFGGNPIVTTAGLATINHLTQTDILDHANKIADYLWNALENLVEHKKEVKSVRGEGLLIGLEVDGKAIDYVNKAREEHQLLIVVAGPQIVRLLPPLTANQEEVEQFIAIMDKIFS
ncbi:acetylornithine aminotransferase [Gracilibacillus orientalis]|uniref:Acetylornithine aminotransferase n=1 Tax=Gracilibacillus orientalis TaxID=334253 RepID=A0A1I4JNL2_9BACI|nr:acetylornithine transaminase [Gracilibacillus orientalis]SFL68064.1 acetylornithine aminotransferase [Gracilibacillus orientalis]